ncbi:hypothetical protein DYB32_000966 [Aphanomyces invadans]|nr:hypothetical protein DYB32_000966 [Aphanomyces invadans]
MCLGSAVSVPFRPDKLGQPSSKGDDTKGLTDSRVYKLTRMTKCPLLWTLQGEADGVVLRSYGRHDVVLFPRVVGTLAKLHRQIGSLDGLAFVRIDAVPLKLSTRPDATIREMCDILLHVQALRRTREVIKSTLQALGPTVYAAFQRDLTSKYHKLALMYMNNYIKNTAPERKRCQERIRTRQTQFKTWFAHMTIDAPSSTSTPAEKEDDLSNTAVIDLASSPPPSTQLHDAQPERKELAPQDSVGSTPSLATSINIQPRPPSPPLHLSSDMDVDMEIDASPPPVELVRRNPAKGRIVHWHVEKLVVACRVSNPDMPDARDVAEIMKEAMDYLMPLDCFSANQLNQTMLAIEADLAKRDAVDIRRLVAPLALSPYLTSFFPTPLKKAVKLRSLNSRGCRVHFSDKLHHVKHFHFDEAPTAVQQALVHVNNDNIREGGPMLPRRPSLPSHPFVDARPAKYIRRN